MRKILLHKSMEGLYNKDIDAEKIMKEMKLREKNGEYFWEADTTVILYSMKTTINNISYLISQNNKKVSFSDCHKIITNILNNTQFINLKIKLIDEKYI